MQTMHKNAHKRESLSKKHECESHESAKKNDRERAPKRAAPTLLRTPSQITPESLPWHCRGTAVALPWHCRGTAEHDALELAALAARGSSGTTHQNGIRTPDPGQEARGEARWAALQGLPYQAALAYKYLLDLIAGHGFESERPRF